MPIPHSNNIAQAVRTVAAPKPSARSDSPRELAGLPSRTAFVYALLFVAAFGFYRTVWPAAPFWAPDSWGYMVTATDLADFRVDRLNSRPPGYPLLMVLTGSSRHPTQTLFHAGLALHFASIWLVGAVLYRLGVKSGWLIVLAVLLLLPPYVEYSGYVLSEILSEFLLVVAFSSIVFWMMERHATSLAVVAGLALACAGLTRPTYQALAIAVAGFVLAPHVGIDETATRLRKCSAAMIMVSTSIILIGGFSAVNYVKFGFFGVYPMSGLNLSTRTVNMLERLPDEYAGEREALIKARAAVLAQREQDQTEYLSYWHAIPDLERVTGLKGIPALSAHMLRLHLILISRAPLSYIREVLWSFTGLWLPSGTWLANMGSRTLQAIWVVVQFTVLALFTLQLIVIAGLAMFRYSQRHGRHETEWGPRFVPKHLYVYGLAGTIVLYNALVTSLVEVGDPRYRVPAEPLVVCMCFLGFQMWRGLLRQHGVEADVQNRLG